MKKSFKVYGMDGHRQKQSFAASKSFTDYNGCKIEVKNFDITGTNEYSIVEIEAETAEKIQKALNGQISDGVFDDCICGKVEEIIDEAELENNLAGDFWEFMSNAPIIHTTMTEDKKDQVKAFFFECKEELERLPYWSDDDSEGLTKEQDAEVDAILDSYIKKIMKNVFGR